MDINKRKHVFPFPLITNALLLLCRVFYGHILCPYSPSWATAQQTMARAGSIVPPSVGMTEKKSGVCILAVFKVDPTFAVINRLLEFL